MSETYRISALKYRPSLFVDVLAQEHITRTLQHSIQKQQTANAYIFAGPRGTGKTTTARILAKALNCTNLQNNEPCNECDNCRAVIKGNHPDVMEIDAASNRQVDEAEALRETTQFTPSLGQFKIYIIDECHMLTNHANNALLKTLEEPPSHVKFIFATTELNKIMPTIKSRCQLFQFRRIPAGVIVERLQTVLKNEAGFAVEDQSELERILYLIAQGSEGGMRDALVSLDQLMAFCSGNLNLAQVEEMLGVVEFDRLHNFIQAVIHHDLDTILHVIEDITNRGREIKWFLKECQQYLRNLMVILISPKQPGLVDLPEDYYAQMSKSCKDTSVEQVLYISDQLWEAERRMFFSPEARMIVEVAAIKAAKAGQASNIKELLKQLSSSGNIQSQSIVESKPASPKTSSAPAPNPQPVKSEPVGSDSKEPITQKEEIKPKPAEVVDEPPIQEPPPKKQSNELDKTEGDIKHVAVKPLSSTITPDIWNEIIEDIEETNPFFVGSLEGASILGEDGNILKISVLAPDKMRLNQLEKSSNKKQLEEKIHQRCGKQLTVKFEIQTSSQSNEDVESSEEPEREQISRGELMERLEKYKNFQILQEKLPGKILHIR